MHYTRISVWLNFVIFVRKCSFTSFLPSLSFSCYNFAVGTILEKLRTRRIKDLFQEIKLFQHREILELFYFYITFNIYANNDKKMLLLPSEGTPLGVFRECIVFYGINLDTFILFHMEFPFQLLKHHQICSFRKFRYFFIKIIFFFF